MAEFFLELFSEEIPANLQQNFREKLLEEFREYFINKSIKSKKSFSLSTPNRVIIVFEGLQKKIKVLKTDNPKSLAKRVLKQEHLLFPKAIKKIKINL